MDYNFRDIEQKWQKYWAAKKTFQAKIKPGQPKYYVLDMFPYPSGAGLHVGHPLGYIASDILSRYKRQKGFNVLHPMGFDAFGLPAEQYAIQTGTHPNATTEKNIKRYRLQLDQLGFSYDWERSVKTSDPSYYKWTQWVFIQLFQHWYDKKADRARHIDYLIAQFEQTGTHNLSAAATQPYHFTAGEWSKMDEVEQQSILMNYRLAYLSDTYVNWCPDLGTVLANDEVKDGLSERGGHVVERKKMKQWSLRITAYAQRLLDGLSHLDWSDSIKDIQSNWIGRSEGASIWFEVENHSEKIEVFTTRPDTLWGATFMVLAPEHELSLKITRPDLLAEVKEYVEWSKNRSERARMMEVKSLSGKFSGAYAKNPVNGEKIPIWIADYVLSGYGTGAIMAVPAHDSRDFRFARHFNLPVIQVVMNEKEQKTSTESWEDSYDAKTGIMINSGFINGLDVARAIPEVIKYLESSHLGRGLVNYRLRDAIFSRQRYWGEPFPVYYKNGMPYTLDPMSLPLELPKIDTFLPTETGDPPLARAENWTTEEGYPLETNTMPGFAGSSAYYYRYMDPHNDKQLVSKEAIDYWQQVDFYVGGDEHATGHLLYARFWSMFLYDLGIAIHPEPFKKLVNQGKIQGRSSFVYREKGSNRFISKGLIKAYEVQALHVDIHLVTDDILDVEAFKAWRPEYADATFVLEDGKYHCGYEIEKMSKSKYNVENPDQIIEKYGADTLRLYEMFLGPIEQDKPWDTKGIEGVFRFIRKFWRLYHNTENEFVISTESPNESELKILHKTIKKVGSDIERFSLNTAISALMIAVNELGEHSCNKKTILEPMAILVSGFAPHLAEELWQLMGHEESIAYAPFPEVNEEYLKEDYFTYPVSFNGKTRFTINLDSTLTKDEMSEKALKADEAQKWLQGKTVRKIIVVPGRIINIVVS